MDTLDFPTIPYISPQEPSGSPPYSRLVFLTAVSRKQPAPDPLAFCASEDGGAEARIFMANSRLSIVESRRENCTGHVRHSRILKRSPIDRETGKCLRGL